jgi:hypothetical protein
MRSGKQLVESVKCQVARALATRPAPPLILTGTLALAGLSAVAMSPVQHHQQVTRLVAPAGVLDLSAPRTFCRPDESGSGHTFCHILASQRNTVPNLGCFDDPDGDGTLVCEYAIYPPVKY